ncbi:MAG: FtsH protease activity modulator HflK [Hyphomonadaceae bacterium]|nr:MAG: membrane protease subunit HflK [Caulobacteraceae bacterium]MBT9444594.1 FtsH protease activity modulator HflK [Hyphomonadaceae bacterium]TPW03937.1 MAG: membrane protease subunit HflK [Alphaproteobacteria bacterium]
MPWNDQSGNDRGNGQGGPKGGPKGGGPWGSGPQKPWGGQQPPRRPDDKGPDLEDMMRRLQNRMRGGRGGGPGAPGLSAMGPSGFMVLGALLVAGWFASGVYMVDEGENGVVSRFGAFHRLTTPGLHVHLPAPIETVRVEPVTLQRSQQVGFREGQDRPSESLMLTGDEAIVDIDFTVIWQLSDRPQDFVFNTRGPDELVLAVAESAMRETVGRTPLERIISTDRSNVETQTRDLMQNTLNSYKAGIKVVRVQLQKATAPEAVIEAFNDVDRARADAESRVNEARGEAARLLQEAEGYRERVVREASGEAERFNLIYNQYRLSPRATRERLYLETMERVYGGADKIIIDGRSGVVPYLPLEQLKNRQAQPAPSRSGGQ